MHLLCKIILRSIKCFRRSATNTFTRTKLYYVHIMMMMMRFVPVMQACVRDDFFFSPSENSVDNDKLQNVR